MACYHPNLMVRGQDGKWHFRGAYTGVLHDKVVFSDGQRNVLDTETGELRALDIDDWCLVPCGQCVGCRIARSRNWANRLMMEKAGYSDDECWFITLTYDNEHVPLNEYGRGTLVPRDLQLWLKRLRDCAGISGIRFYACGEYGEHTYRPHYHLILFGLPKDKLGLTRFGASDKGQPYFQSILISQTWRYGFHSVANVDWNTCAYVARYVTKKLTGDAAEWYKQQQICPEFSRMSRRPGIGREYLEKHKAEIMRDDTIYLSGGRMTKPPPYFDKILSEEYPLYMERIKADRKKGVDDATSLKLAQTDLDYVNLLKLEEDAFKAKIKKLKRSAV